MPDRHAVREMFEAIAPRYDFLNHLLSAGIDRRWRRKAVAIAQAGAQTRALDVCCGTGDSSLELARAGARVVACDFAPSMIALARRKPAGEGGANPNYLVADAMALPFADSVFDVVSVGFGIRNVEDLDAGVAEMARVTRPGGKVVILEFSTPPGAFVRSAFGFYFHRVLPRIGNALAGVRTDAYQYLPDSVRAFPAAPELARRMERAGLRGVRFCYLSGGIAAIHAGER